MGKALFSKTYENMTLKESILFMNKTAEQLKVVIKNDKFKYYDTTLPINKEEYRPKGGQGAPVNLTYADELRKAREAAEAQYKAQEEGAQQ